MKIRLYKVTAEFRDLEYKSLPDKTFIVIGSSNDDAIDRTRAYVVDELALLASASLTSLRAVPYAAEDIAEL